MIKILLVFIYSLTLFSCFEKQIKVIERTSAMLVEPGYYIGENDSTFEFMNHRYLIKTREFFDDDEMINRVAILKSEGYLEFSKAEFGKLKNFLDDHEFNKTLKTYIIDDDHISVNTKSFIIKEIDRKRKMIFYSSSSGNDPLYYLVYK